MKTKIITNEEKDKEVVASNIRAAYEAGKEDAEFELEYPEGYLRAFKNLPAYEGFGPIKVRLLRSDCWRGEKRPCKLTRGSKWQDLYEAYIRGFQEVYFKVHPPVMNPLRAQSIVYYVQGHQISE